jgi:hypothetical protein
MSLSVVGKPSPHPKKKKKKKKVARFDSFIYLLALAAAHLSIQIHHKIPA